MFFINPPNSSKKFYTTFVNIFLKPIQSFYERWKKCVSTILPVSVNCQPVAGITAFPNPASKLLHIDGATAGQQLQLIDVYGRKWVKKQIRKDTESISLTSFLPGIYQVVITSTSGERLTSIPLLI